ncbi:acyl-CoA oxidase [Sugiyamaella lignohabitans]|uniref:acyl-CoA oxidase n=1 Tax=Sugiyamaella lignohabitans TaxID=796027 RepID=A0A161HI27_9ASCO|nr:acyl-CoA oxidase [Sugiyamaella lignohabitans]ANB12017.1 acyl-CoA oxidase [Sugiyamaella lignohabitans]
MGRDGVDNGWITFSNVRIPRTFMMMRFARVDKNGNVTQPPLAQLAYGALIGGRVSMAADSFQVAKKFITIAVRYGAARRQFSSEDGQPETKLLDYTYHQRRLLPLLAYTYAMRTAADGLYDMYYNATEKLANTNVSDKQGLQSAIEDIKELFSLSAGLKAFSTWGCGHIIDEARQSCGGHGYSSYNAFGPGYADWIVNTIWEGDNNVLTLSAGRALVQSGVALRKGKRLGGPVEYLSRSEELKNAGLGSNHDSALRDPATIIKSWESICSQAINSTVDKFLELTQKENLSLTQAFEQLSLQRFQIARIHTRLYVIRSFFERVEKTQDGPLKKAVLDVALLFALWSIENESGIFLKYNFFTPDDLDTITELVNEYCRKVRVNAIGLTDAFNLSDYYINSAIGNYNGDFYKSYFEKVTRRNPPEEIRPPYYDSLMRPFFDRTNDEA